MKIQLNIIRLFSLIIAQGNCSLQMISESHTVILLHILIIIKIYIILIILIIQIMILLLMLIILIL